MSFQLPLVAAGSPEATSGVVVDGGVEVRRTVLPGGARVLTERIPGAQSATVGMWVGVGSRDEAAGRWGSTHFLEHLLFKGTPSRNAHDIAIAFDEVGGESNALTGKEHTCYYARVIDTDLPMAVATLLDMVTSSLIAPDEFELERGVICEELAMIEDDLHNVVHEKFAEAVFGDHDLGRPIGGTVAAIQAVSRDAVWEHYRSTYRSDALVVTAAGGVDHDRLCELVLAGLAAGNWATTGEVTPALRRSVDFVDLSDDAAGRTIEVVRSAEQTNLIVGCEGMRVGHEKRQVSSVLGAILGGGMSSRLFQEVREKRGLAYSVYAFGQGHSDTGIFGMYAGCQPSRADEVASLMADELAKMANEPVTPEELARAKGQLTGNLVLSLEDTSTRMSRLGRAELWTGELDSIAEIVARVRAVTAEDVQALAADFAARPRAMATVGPAG